MPYLRFSLLALALASCAGSAAAQQYQMQVAAKGLQPEAAQPAAPTPAPPATAAIGAVSGLPDFGVVVEGDTVTRNFTFTNSGNAAATNVHAWLSGYPELSVLANGCGTVDAPVSVPFAAGANTCQMTLAYTPTSGVSALAGSQLEVEGNFTGSPRALALAGTATPLTVTLAAATPPTGLRGSLYGPNGEGYDLATHFSTNSQSPLPHTPSAWSVTAGTLPAGLTLSAQGRLSGTPTASTQGVPVTVTASYKNKSAQQAYTIVVDGIPMVASQVVTSGGASCAIVSGAVYCWGTNSDGQLGSSGNALHPVALPVLTSGVTKVTVASLGGCAIKSGAAYCWGRNTYGQLGDGTTTNRAVPVPVSGLGAGVTDISRSSNTACAVHNGAAKCWGSDSSGVLGNGAASTTASSVPVQVVGLTANVTQINATNPNSTACAIQSGAAKCWGSNTYGQLGTGSTGGSADSPANVSGLSSGVSKLTLGTGATCALHNGAVKCWGNNPYGQLGNGTTANSAVPVLVTGLGSNVSDIATGDSFACAVQSGAAKCWGWNLYGQLGDGTVDAKSVPTAVVGLGANVSGLNAGATLACALHAGVAKCWGRGAFGDGTAAATRPTASPVLL